MSASVIPGRRGFRRVYVGAVLESMWVGLGEDRQNGDKFPAVYLFYPRGSFASVLIVAQEMQQRSQLPKFFMQSAAESADLVVLFRLSGVGFDVISRLVTLEALRQASSDLLTDDMEVIATGETELSYPDLVPFMEALQRSGGKFRVCLAEELEGDEVAVRWHAELSQIESGKPDLESD